MKRFQQFTSFGNAVFAITGTLMTTTLVSNPVLAQQFYGQPYFPGTMCQSYNGENLFTRYITGTFNNGNSSVVVICPIPQRYPEDDAGSKRSALIQVSSGSRGGRVSCSLFADDGTGKISGVGSATDSGTGLLFTPPGPKGLVYNLLCTLPVGTGIINYGLYEPAQ